MTNVQVIEQPSLDGKRRALVLTEDRVGHYPEFREFFVRRFSLDTDGLSKPGYVRAPRERSIRSCSLVGVESRFRTDSKSMRSLMRWSP
jgi:hypothetical protein